MTISNLAWAGSVARWIREEGATVTYVIITDGGAGSNDPDMTREQLIELRYHEQIEAAARVGVHDVRFLGHPDGVLQATLDVRRDITRIIRETKPYRVVCQDPTSVFVHRGYVNHPDHRAAGEASIYAVFPSAETRPIFPELLAEGFEPHKVGELYLNLTQAPTHFHDISSTIDLKMRRPQRPCLADRRRRRFREWRQEVADARESRWRPDGRRRIRRVFPCAEVR